jgi:hypothetical protein
LYSSHVFEFIKKVCMKKIRILLSVYAVISLMMACSGCYEDDCNGTDTEPSVVIYVERPAAYTYAYGVKDRVEAIPMSSYGVSVPLSLRQNKTTICFMTPGGRIDKLSVTYTRQPVAESLKCGVRLYVLDIRVIEPTTFNRVSIVDNQIYINNE